MTALQRLADWLSHDWGRSAQLASNMVGLSDGVHTVRGQAATLEGAIDEALYRWATIDDPQGMAIEPAPTTQRVVTS